ncbi:MAG: DUF721 domain-containing protein [Deltaproteobacteria bacterium]|nr:DUF721 domain-containing protein [Deltaproteobacteria bacterium]
MKTKKRKYNKEFTRVGSLIENIITNIRPESDKKMMGIWKVWKRAVGDVIASNAQPEAFKGGLLIVKVSGSVWAQQLQFQKRELIQKINEALDSELVKDIRFKIGSLRGRP